MVWPAEVVAREKKTPPFGSGFAGSGLDNVTPVAPPPSPCSLTRRSGDVRLFMSPAAALAALWWGPVATARRLLIARRLRRLAHPLSGHPAHSVAALVQWSTRLVGGRGTRDRGKLAHSHARRNRGGRPPHTHTLTHSHTHTHKQSRRRGPWWLAATALPSCSSHLIGCMPGLPAWPCGALALCHPLDSKTPADTTSGAGCVRPGLVCLCTCAPRPRHRPFPFPPFSHRPSCFGAGRH